MSKMEAFIISEKDKLQSEHAEIQKKYNELLHAVGRKYPNESRHETALKYIKNAEKDDDKTAKCAGDGSEA